MDKELFFKSPKIKILVVIAGIIICFLLLRVLNIYNIYIPGILKTDAVDMQYMLAMSVVAISSVIFGGIAGGVIGFFANLLMFFSWYKIGIDIDYFKHCIFFEIIPAALYGLFIGIICKKFVPKTKENILIENTLYVFLLTSLSSVLVFLALFIVRYFIIVIIFDFFSAIKWCIIDYYDIKDFFWQFAKEMKASFFLSYDQTAYITVDYIPRFFKWCLIPGITAALAAFAYMRWAIKSGIMPVARKTEETVSAGS